MQRLYSLAAGLSTHADEAFSILSFSMYIKKFLDNNQKGGFVSACPKYFEEVCL